MTDEQIIEKLAVSVMGFTSFGGGAYQVSRFTNGPDEIGKINSTGFIREWNPLENIADSFMVLEKIGLCWDLHFLRAGADSEESNRYKCYLYCQDEPAIEDTPQKAICNAALKWLKTKND